MALSGWTPLSTCLHTKILNCSPIPLCTSALYFYLIIPCPVSGVDSIPGCSIPTVVNPVIYSASALYPFPGDLCCSYNTLHSLVLQHIVLKSLLCCAQSLPRPFPPSFLFSFSPGATNSALIELLFVQFTTTAAVGYIQQFLSQDFVSRHRLYTSLNTTHITFLHHHS